MRFADSHCHLTDRSFLADRAEVLRRARAASVDRVVAIASDAEDSLAALDLARASRQAAATNHDGPDAQADGGQPALWCTAGVHPHAAGGAAKRTDIGAVRGAAAHPRCVAIGETGLDYHYDFAPRDAQRRSFSRHVELAWELGLPLVVHSRSAEDDTTAVLQDCAGRVAGVLHCFTGSRALLDRALEAGWMVSFTGIATFRSFDAALARRAPADRYMIETDAPYLAPVPKRGRRNEPALVPHVAEALAHHRGETLAQVAADSWDNAERFFGLEEDRP